MLEKYFKLKEHNTTVKQEVIAGLTTFLTMAYILAVNPNILSASGMSANAVFVATAIASAIATFIMAFLANYPIGLSAGLGLNAYFAYTVCLGELAGEEDPFRIALTAVFVEGVLFILLSFFKFREQIINGIPQNLKFGISAGIGLFVAFIGMQNARIIVANDATVVGLGSFSDLDMVLALVGLVIIAALVYYKVTGGVLIGILVTWLIGIILQLAGT